MSTPPNLEDLRRFLGMTNYLSKFLPNFTNVTEPLRNLTRKDVPWNWSTSQENSLKTVKKMVTEAPVLAYYDPSKELTLENDACEHRIGCVLMQCRRPVAYASRSLTDTEKRYSV